MQSANGMQKSQPLGQSSTQVTSQIGKEKRYGYRTKSSGYGTGSSQGSSDKSEGTLEEDVFEDLYTAPKVVEHTPKRQFDSDLFRVSELDGVLEILKHSSTLNSVTSNETLLASSFAAVGDEVLIPRLSVLLNNSQPSDNRSQTEDFMEGRSRNSLPQHDSSSYTSGQEVSFELQSWQSNGADSAADDHQMSVTSTESVTSLRDLVNQWPLPDYLSNQQESPNFSPNSSNLVGGLVNDVVYDQRQSDTTPSNDALMSRGFPSQQEECLSSIMDSGSSFSSIFVPNDQQVPQAVVDRMYTSAQSKWKKDAFQNLLSTLALNEDDTTSFVFQEIEKFRFASELPSGTNASSRHQSVGPETGPSDLEMLDNKLKALNITHEDLQDALAAGESFEQSRSFYDYPDLEELTSPPLPSGIQGEEEADRELLFERLQVAALCLDKTCQNVECSLGQELLRHLEERLEQNLTYESISCQKMLKSIAWHAEICEELKCPVPYCQFFQETDIRFAEQIARLQQTLYSCFTQIAEPSSASDLFMKVCASLPKENRPLKQDVDWNVISKMGRFGQGPYYVHSSVYDSPASSDIPFDWVVKKMNNNFHGASLLGIDTQKNDTSEVEVLRALTGNAREHLIHLLWFLFQQPCVLMCSRFEGMPLKEHVSSKECGMGKDLTFTYLKQLISATAYLHVRHILYLNWTCDHVVVVTGLDSTAGRVKLCNLTTAVVCRRQIDDEDLLEEIMMTLPPHVMAPELSSLRHVGKYSDIWGLGCVAFEMYCGYKVHNKFRHFDLISQRSKIAEEPVPNVASVKEVAVLNVLNSAFEIESERRATLSQLDAMSSNG